MRHFFAVLIFIGLSSCDSNLGKDRINCKNALVDETLETLSLYNKEFYEENYTGTVTSKFDSSVNQIQWILYYVNGEIEKYESFYINGDPMVVKPVKCNSVHGNFIYYMDNYKKGYEMEYKLGRKDGVGKSYFENGRIQKFVQFKNDKKHGEQYEFSEFRDTLLIEKFNNGVRTSVDSRASAD
jgi:antitoxin component YwqK of YwqJK toxin-antitoxin module